MKKTNINKFFYIFVLFLCLFLNINSVKADRTNDITCEYEMLPLNIIVDGSNLKPENINVLDLPTTYEASDIARITFKGKGKNDCSAKLEKNFGVPYENKTLNAKAIGKKIKKDKYDCPKYINNYLSKLTVNKSIPDYNAVIYNENYPLVLVKQDGKVVEEPMNQLITHAITNWNNFVESDIYKNASSSEQTNYLKYKAAFISATKKSSIYNSTISKNNQWNNFVNSEKVEKEINEKEDKLNKVKGDYCSLYCTTQCKNVTPSSAQSACNSSCEIEQLPKCKAAVQACLHATLSEYDNCINTQLNTQGLNTNYSADRNAEIQNLEKEIEELYKVSRASTTGLKLNFNNAKLECKDVVSLHKYWVLFEIISPILVILFGSIDFITSITASDEEKIIKARKKFPKRLAAAIILIFASLIINVIVNVSTNESVRDTSLMRCIINGN